jgi:DNA adenine methylase
MTDVEKAAYYYILIKNSFGSNTKSFNAQPSSISSGFPAIIAAHQRLEKTGVIIENRSYDDLLARYPGDRVLRYIDPPYYGTEKMYLFANFGIGDHILLRDILFRKKGLWLLSYNDCPEIRKLYEAENVFIMEISRLHNFRQQYDPGSMFGELLIANYRLDEQFAKRNPEQLMLL